MKEPMSPERAQMFKTSVDSKLLEQKIDVKEQQKAEQALARCVMGGALVSAYRELYVKEQTK